VFSAFSLISEGIDAWKDNAYNYRIVQTATGHFYVEDEKLVPISDAKAGEPVLRFVDPILAPKGCIANVPADIQTTVGCLFVNAGTLAYAFGAKIPYVNGEFNVGKIEETIVKVLTDTPEEGTPRDPKLIYVDEYLVFADAMQHLTVYTQLCVWSATEKTMTAPPGIAAYRTKLLKENEGHLHDPEVIAKIDKQLVAFDAEYLKGDPGENFLLSGKSRNIVRKKLFLMHGAEQGIEGGVGVKNIENSLAEGWDIKQWSLMNDSLRSGSFNRGAETQLGGEATKWLFRASSNAAVTQDDCGTRVGMRTTVTPENVKKLVGFSLVATEGAKFIATEEEAGKYLGKTVMKRSPMFCKLEKTDYCKACVGVKLASNPTAVSLAVAAYGSEFMSLFMKAMHGKSLTVAKMDYRTALS
jgi:hypothetical protein